MREHGGEPRIRHVIELRRDVAPEIGAAEHDAVPCWGGVHGKANPAA